MLSPSWLIFKLNLTQFLPCNSYFLKFFQVLFARILYIRAWVWKHKYWVLSMVMSLLLWRVESLFARVPVPANRTSSMRWLLPSSTWHTHTAFLTGPDRSASCRSRRGKHSEMDLKLWWVGRSLLVSACFSQVSFEKQQNLQYFMGTCISGISIFTNFYSCCGLRGRIWTSFFWQLCTSGAQSMCKTFPLIWTSCFVVV